MSRLQQRSGYRPAPPSINRSVLERAKVEQLLAPPKLDGCDHSQLLQSQSQQVDAGRGEANHEEALPEAVHQELEQLGRDE